MTTVKGYQGRRLICDFQFDGRSFKETGKVQVYLVVFLARNLRFFFFVVRFGLIV